ncbi:MAG TPA: zinc ribbon domain-containing protein [Gaiellaceae bacterium]|nr:zinc ribbon domain-containing protein [Gaiellaceae bacterium]
MTGSAFGSIHSALHSSALSVAGNVLILFAVVLWLGLAFRVYRDARRRIDDEWLVGLSTALGVGLPYVGPLVYLLFRPPETLADAHAREVELRALRGRLLQGAPHCPVCLTEVESDYLVCPVCTTRLREQCRSCDSALDPLWQACPYCATPLTPHVADLDAALTAEVAVNGNLAHRRAQRLTS